MSLLSFEYQNYKPDSALLIAQQLYDYATQKGSLFGQSLGLDGLAGAFLRIGDNAKALEYYLQRLSIEEKRNIPYNVAIIYMNIANVYAQDNEQQNALEYILKTDSIINHHDFKPLKLYAYLNTGNILEKADKLLEAIAYTQKSYEEAFAVKDSLILGSALNNLGNIYSKTKDYHTAIKYYRKSHPYVVAVKDNQTFSEGLLGLAKAYLAVQKKDSALFYAREAYQVSYHNGILSNAMTASGYLSDFFKELKMFDSAYYYQSQLVALKDSLQSNEKIKQIESLTIQEELREKHNATLKKQAEIENKQRLQLLAIGIAIPFFFLFSNFISRRKIHRRAIQFSGGLSLLLLFEYITLLIHPIVVEITHHNPIFEIMIFVVLAALLVPAHHKVEHWFTKKLAINYEEARVRKKIAEEIKEQQDDNSPETGLGI